MPRNRWDSLPPEVKKLWDSLDDDSKAIILGNIDPKTKLPAEKSTNPRRPPKQDNRTRSSNQHEILRAFLTNTKQNDSDEEDEEVSDETEVDTDRLEQFTQTLLAFNAAQTAHEKSKASHPADIRSVLSQPRKKATTPTKSNNSQMEVHEVVFNGNTYRLVKDGAS